MILISCNMDILVFIGYDLHIMFQFRGILWNAWPIHIHVSSGLKKNGSKTQANFKERFPSCSRVKGEQSMSVSTGNGRSSMMYGGTDTPLYCSPRVIDKSGGLYLGGTNIEDSLPNKIILAVHPEKWSTHTRIILISFCKVPQIAMFMGSTWGPPGSCRLQMGPMLAPWTLLSETGFPI